MTQEKKSTGTASSTAAVAEALKGLAKYQPSEAFSRAADARRSAPAPKGK